MRPRKNELQLLAICAIPDVNWNVVARAAQRSRLDLLLQGEYTEKRGKDADKTRAAVRKALKTFDDYLDRARHAIRLAAGVGAELTTALAGDDVYPTNLRLVWNLPPFLFYRGELQRDDARSVAVVGTRNASKEGLSAAMRMAKCLVEQDVTVLSGLARGIDSAAHEAALSAGGRTIAVIGTGILRTYPKENEQLAERIAGHGAIVSQFWPDAPPAGFRFPMRNVVTSGMGQGTVVIEASATSGAKMQARLALDHQKRVFLVSRLVTNQSWARTYLRRGAIEVRRVDDVLSRLRSPDQIEQQSASRLQMTLEPA
jgi:DNA processing protein